MAGDAFTFSAFISYARRDRAEAVHLQRRLEQYRLDADLRVKEGERLLPARPLQPIFRDEDELIPGQDLPARIRKGLEQSRFLIVLASPAAVKSDWVEKEILDFMALGKADRIIVLAIEGNPNAARRGKKPETECLPRPFRFKFTANRQPTEEEVPTPNWLDWRGSKKRDRIAFLRVVAALLELERFDDLVQRDAQRERRRLRAWATGIGAAGAVVLGLAVMTFLFARTNAQTTSKLFAELAEQAFQESRFEAAMRWALSGVRTGDKELLSPEGADAFALVSRAHWAQSLHRTLKGHTAEVPGARFSPDGKWQLTWSTDGTARLWEVKTGRQSAVLQHKDAVGAAEFSRDGRFVITGSHDKTAKLWEVPTGRHLRTFEGHTARVTSAAFSPDGRHAVTAGQGKSVKIWDAQSGTLVRTMTIEDAITVGYAQFTPGGAGVVAASTGTIRHWDRQTGALKAEIAAEDEILGLAVSPDGTTIAAIAQGGILQAWEAQTGKLRFKAEHDSFMIHSLHYSADGSRLITSASDGARVWDSASGEFVLEAPLSVEGGVLDAVFSPDGRRIATAGDDGAVRLWSNTGGLLRTYRGHSTQANSVQFSPSGTLLASASDDGTVKLWAADPGGAVEILVGHEGGIEDFAVSPRGDAIVGVGRDKSAIIWDVITAKVRFRLEDTSLAYVSVRWSPDGQVAALIPREGAILLWDVKSGQTRPIAQSQSGTGRAAGFSPDGRFLVTGQQEGHGQIWDVGTGALLARLSGHSKPLTAALFAPDGRTVLTASHDGTARLWDARTGGSKAVLKGHAAEVWSAVFSPRGDAIVTASLDKTAKIWAPATGALRLTLAGHAASVVRAIYTEDGRSIATASQDKTARLWDPSTGTLVHVLSRHTEPVTELSFAPGGRLLMTNSSDQTIRLWDTESGLLLAAAGGGNEGAALAQFVLNGTSIVGTAGKAFKVWTVPRLAMPRAAQVAAACARLAEIGEREIGLLERARPIMAGRGRDPCNREGLLSWSWWQNAVGW